MKGEDKVKGIHSWAVFLPTIIVIAVLHVAVIITTVLISTTSAKMSKEMQQSASYIDDVSQLMGGSSLLSETATSFAYMPQVVNDNGEYEINGALRAYISELDLPRRPKDILPKVDNYNVSNEIKEKIKMIAKAIDEMMDDQAHAIYLINSVYPLTNIPGLNLSKLETYTLTTDEENMSNEEKLHAAISLLYSTDYINNKSNVSKFVAETQSAIKAEASLSQADTLKLITVFRALLMIFTILIITNMILFFVILIWKLINPIVSSAKKIKNDEKLNVKQGLYEVNLLASSYNGLFDRREMYEEKLKEAAETDSLTGLPNRYSYNNFVINEVKEGHSVCLYTFDINNLKIVNDTLGHNKGDKLIIDSALCITECFQMEGKKNCYRFGGDEFAAIIVDIEENQIQDYIDKFIEAQKRYNISVSVGCAYTKDIALTNYEDLLIQADKEMYKNKKIAHEAMEK